MGVVRCKQTRFSLRAICRPGTSTAVIYRPFSSELKLSLVRRRRRLVKMVGSFLINLLSEVKLPLSVTLGDIYVFKKSGSDFIEHEKFCKQTVIDALATSKKFTDDGNAKTKSIKAAVEGRIGRDVNIVILEEKSDLNTFTVWQNSELYLKVKGLIFYFFTPLRD